MADVAEQGFQEAADIQPAGAVYTLWRAVQPSSRFPSPIAMGLTAPPFADTTGLPGVTYYYTLTKYTPAEAAGGTLETSPEVSAVFPSPPAQAHAKDTDMTRIFSTGQLFVDTGGGPIELAVLQEISWEMPFQEKELRTAPWLNMFAEARAFYGGKMTMKAKNAEVRADALRILVAGVNTPAVPANPAAQPPTAAVPGVMTVGRIAVLPAFSAVFQTQDESGNLVSVTCGKVHAPGVTLPFKLEDYVYPDFTMVADEDAAGVVATWKFAV